MKQKLFDKFAELFGNSDGVNFYFSRAVSISSENIPIITEVMYFRVH